MIRCALDVVPPTVEPQELLELGVGSGALLLSLLQLYPNAKGTGVDVSQVALAVRCGLERSEIETYKYRKACAINRDVYNLGNRCTVRYGDWQEPCPAVLRHRFHLVVANPPYLTSEEAASPELKYEPRGSLFAGANGLQAYISLAKCISDYMRDYAYLVLEIGSGQAAQVSAWQQGSLDASQYNTQVAALLGAHESLECKGVLHDLGGMERVLIFRRVPKGVH